MSKAESPVVEAPASETRPVAEKREDEKNGPSLFDKLKALVPAWLLAFAPNHVQVPLAIVRGELYLYGEATGRKISNSKISRTVPKSHIGNEIKKDGYDFEKVVSQNLDRLAVTLRFFSLAIPTEEGNVRARAKNAIPTGLDDEGNQTVVTVDDNVRTIHNAINGEW